MCIKPEVWILLNFRRWAKIFSEKMSQLIYIKKLFLFLFHTSLEYFGVVGISTLQSPLMHHHTKYIEMVFEFPRNSLKHIAISGVQLRCDSK